MKKKYKGNVWRTGIALVMVLSGLVLLQPSSMAYGAPFSRSQSPKAGMRTLTLHNAQAEKVYDAAVWYPTVRAESVGQDGEWSFRCAKNAKISEGVFPLVVISHDSGGSKHSLHDLAALLARNRCIVFCLTHEGDNSWDSRLAFSKNLLPLRAIQLRRALETFLELPEWREHIDLKRVGLVGLGSGAATVLILAGAALNEEGYKEYCARSGQEDKYCTPWAQARLDRPEPFLHVDGSFLSPAFLVLAAPEFGMFISRQVFRFPVLSLSPTRFLSPADRRQKALFEALVQGEVIRRDIPGFFASDFLASCPVPMEEPTAMCRPGGTVKEDRREKEFLGIILNFILDVLKKDS